MQAGKASAATFDRTTSFPAGQRGRAGSLHGMMSSVLCSLQHISNFEADFRPASKNRRAKTSGGDRHFAGVIRMGHGWAAVNNNLNLKY
jgi:hypothetical protein